MFSKHLTKTQNTVLGLIIFCLFIVFLRIQLTQSIRYLFLVWNLFLAIIPYLISEVLLKVKTSKFKLTISLFIWILFLPNAPYIITDFIHFHNLETSMLWYDLFTIFCFALSGLLLGVFSMLNVYKVIQEKWSLKVAENSFPTICFLCGFGIYLGRFLRFNSWDIISSPVNLLIESIQCFGQPECWYITLGFGFLQWLIFMNLKMWKENN